MGPPKALDCPNPMSSSNTITTFGAPLGAVTLKRRGHLTLRASSSVITGGFVSGIGSTVRSKASCDPPSRAKPTRIKSCKTKRETLLEPFPHSEWPRIVDDSLPLRLERLQRRPWGPSSRFLCHRTTSALLLELDTESQE